MFLKPKMTLNATKAMLFRRYSGYYNLLAVRVIYVTEDGKNWVYNNIEDRFVDIVGEVMGDYEIVEVESGATALTNGKKTYIYLDFKWQETQPTEALKLVNSTIAKKYELNKYRYVGTFNYSITGGIERSEGQFIKGNIMNLTSFRIKHFNDEISLDHDDLVVANGCLYSVEAPTVTPKYQPKPYFVYTATLNKII